MINKEMIKLIDTHGFERTIVKDYYDNNPDKFIGWKKAPSSFIIPSITTSVPNEQNVDVAGTFVEGTKPQAFALHCPICETELEFQLNYAREKQE